MLMTAKYTFSIPYTPCPRCEGYTDKSVPEGIPGEHELRPGNDRCPGIDEDVDDILETWESPGTIVKDEFGERYWLLARVTRGWGLLSVHEGPNGSRVEAVYGVDEATDHPGTLTIQCGENGYPDTIDLEPGTPCQCPLSGFCPTHQRHMSETRHFECSTRPGYFEAFQAAKKPQVTQTPDKPSKSCTGCQKRKDKLNNLAPSFRLGDRVEAVTRATGIKTAWERITGQDDG